VTNVDFSFDHFPVLEMERYALRQIREADAEAVFAYLSDAEVMRYRSADPLVKFEDAVVWIQQRESEFREGRILRWAIARREDDRFIGTVLYHQIDLQNFRAEIGADLAKEYWSQGVITEVMKTALAFGFENMGLNRIDAMLHPENIGSRRVLEKSGFELEGILKEFWFVRGTFWDAMLMSLLKKDYLQRLGV
jgi:ribosomal-protein-alanine N-acetyltransferase